MFLRPASLLLPLLCHWLGEPDGSVLFSGSDASALRGGHCEETIALVFPDCLSWLEPLSCEPAETRQISILMCWVPGIKLYPVSGCEVEDRSPRPLSSSCLGWVFCNIDLWEVRNTDNLLSPGRVPGWELERERSPVSWLHLSGIELPYAELERSKKWVLHWIPQTHCSHQDLLDFLEDMFPFLLYALRKISRDFKWFFRNSFYQL